MIGRFACMAIVSGCLRQLIFFYLVGVYFLGLKVKPPDFYQVLFEILQNLHHFAVHLITDALTLSK
mgnify:CR=1 FL=1